MRPRIVTGFGVALVAVALMAGGAAAADPPGSLSNLSVDPVSDLVWRNTDAIVFLLLAAVGAADITDDAFLDDDFAASDRQARFSATRSLVEGGFRLLR